MFCSAEKTVCTTVLELCLLFCVSMSRAVPLLTALDMVCVNSESVGVMRIGLALHVILNSAQLTAVDMAIALNVCLYYI